MRLSVRPWMLAALLSTILTACETIPTTETPDLSCTAFSKITFSGQNDTAVTVRQIREHNAAYDAICHQS